MRPSPELAALAVRELDRLVAAFPVGYRPALEWRAFRTTAGMAYYRRRAIGLGAGVLTTSDRLVDTLVHEYAHLLAFARFGTRGLGHGAAWRQAMRDLDAEPTVRHTYEAVRNVARQTVHYRCLRCEAPIERRRRLPQGRVYVHARCGGSLRLEKVVRS